MKKIKEQKITDQVKDTEDLTDAMLDSEKPGSGIPFNNNGGKSRKVDKTELGEKLDRGYI